MYNAMLLSPETSSVYRLRMQVGDKLSTVLLFVSRGPEPSTRL